MEGREGRSKECIVGKLVGGLIFACVKKTETI